MGNFYFDIETTGLNPKEPIGELRILKEWESSEKEIISQFLSDTNILDNYTFSFIPVGYNLNFEHGFLKERTKINDLPLADILNNPFFDLRVIGILMNNGEFKGSGLDKLTGKEGGGSNVPIWYKNHEYEKIIEYVKQETREFIKFNVWLYKKLPFLLSQFREESKIY